MGMILPNRHLGRVRPRRFSDLDSLGVSYEHGANGGHGGDEKNAEHEVDVPPEHPQRLKQVAALPSAAGSKGHGRARACCPSRRGDAGFPLTSAPGASLSFVFPGNMAPRQWRCEQQVIKRRPRSMRHAIHTGEDRRKEMAVLSPAPSPETDTCFVDDFNKLA
jgi:hypothetical protein